MLLVVMMLILLLLLLALDSMDASRSLPRRSVEAWMTAAPEIRGQESLARMHAFVVKDESVTGCQVPADKVTKSRYFMCSGAVVSENHVLTSASCITRALIDEFEIHADLAVMIKAVDLDSHVIRVNHYEIHPRFTPDPNAINYHRKNVAILTLSCPISRRTVVIPRLPSKQHEDVGHLCCGTDACKLFTVVENSDNRHVLSEIKVKHVPPPSHVRNETSNTSVKQKRDATNETEIQNSSDVTERSNELDHQVSMDYDNDEFDESMKGLKREDDKSTESIDWFLIHREILNNDVTYESREKLINFAKNTVSDIMTKLLEIITLYISNLDSIFPHLLSIIKKNLTLKSNRLNEIISDTMGRDLLRLALNKLDVQPIENPTTNKPVIINCSPAKTEVKTKKEEQRLAINNNNTMRNATIEKPVELNNNFGLNKTQMNYTNENSSADINDDVGRPVKQEVNTNAVIKSNVYCPPLGSPVIINNTLVALIAYTCDDVQNWVEWRYVDIVRNILWIRKEMKRNLSDIEDNVSSYTMYHDNMI